MAKLTANLFTCYSPLPCYRELLLKSYKSFCTYRVSWEFLMTSFWNGFVPVASVTSAIFFLGFGALIVATGWAPWLVSYQGIAYLGIWYLVSSIFSYSCLLATLTKRDFRSGIKLGALASLISIGLSLLFVVYAYLDIVGS